MAVQLGFGGNAGQRSQLIAMRPFEDGWDFTRRDFLKLAGLGLIGTLAPFSLVRPARAETDRPLGRVLGTTIPLYNSPSFKSKQVQTAWKDHVLPITDVTVGDNDPPYNRVWYQLNGEGYAHSGSVQPVKLLLNEPAGSVPQSGQVGEVSVPYTDARKELEGEAITIYRLYYGSAYWIVSVVADPNGKAWYGILDDRLKSVFYAEAKHIRLIPSQELCLLSPEVPAARKWLEVYIQHQAVIAYEDDKPVFMTRAATGARLASGNFSTLPGKYMLNRKSPSRHMASGDKVSADGFDLPGVPWVSFFTEDGIAFHGTYWHNNYGLPRSHGCVNVTSAAAKWIYLWSTPTLASDQVYLFEPPGTAVEII
jgi:hypothetical protein